MRNTINIKNTTYIVPCNDGESKKIVEICKTLGLDVRVSLQGWGASLDKEPADTFNSLKSHVVVVEMPGIDKENQLKASGHDLRIIDHHIYKLGDKTLDKSNKKSSLEQFAELAGYSLNRFETGIAFNDRGYIWLLRKEGYTDDEIDEIRRYDLMAQGYKEEEFNISINEYKKGKSIPDKNLYIVETTLGKVSYIVDIHQFKFGSSYDLLIFHNGNNRISEVNFYGNPDRCKRMFSRFGGWIGGDEKFSMFWGCNRDVPHRDAVLEILSGTGNIYERSVK